MTAFDRFRRRLGNARRLVRIGLAGALSSRRASQPGRRAPATPPLRWRSASR